MSLLHHFIIIVCFIRTISNVTSAQPALPDLSVAEVENESDELTLDDSAK